MNELTMWKWLVPAGLVPLLGGAAMWLGEFDGFLYCASALVGLMAIFAVQGWAGFRAYFRELESVQYERKHTALANTAEVRLFEMARTMHPQTVQLLLKHRREVWRIRESKDIENVTWVLDADPRINVMFVEHVLRNSNPYSMMAKRMLNDKSRGFDPLGVVTDYEQYDAFEALCKRRGYLTDGFGNMPGVWVEPWKPELVAKRFGLSLVDEVEEEEAVSG